MAKKMNKNKTSSKTALILSSVVLCLCVVVLCLTVSFTATAESPKAPKSVVEQDFSTKKSTEELSLSETSSRTELNSTKINSRSEQSLVGNNSSSENNAVATKTRTEQKVLPSVSSPKIYIVLDDGGHNTAQLNSFMNLPFPFAVAVLPHLAHSSDCAKIIVENNKTLMLHQPMQAINLDVNPGPGSIQPEMSQSEAISVVINNIENVTSELKIEDKKKLVGLNNHEGSLITENADLIKAVMQICKDRGIFFLDSRTNSKSVCRAVAKETSVNFYERDIFLDNTQNQSEMIAQFRKGAAIAKKNGSVIMIGHVWSGENLADVLQKMYSEYSSQGFEFRSF